MLKRRFYFSLILRSFLFFVFIGAGFNAQAGLFNWLKNISIDNLNFSDFVFQNSSASMAPGDVCISLPATSVGGNIWEDYNFNGVKDESTITGISGITVNVYGCDGLLLNTVVTNGDGDWSLDVSVAPACNGCTEVRVEYVNIPSNMEPTPGGNDNGSAIQILTPGSCSGLGLITHGNCVTPFDYSTTLGDPFPLSKHFSDRE